MEHVSFPYCICLHTPHPDWCHQWLTRYIPRLMTLSLRSCKDRYVLSPLSPNSGTETPASLHCRIGGNNAFCRCKKISLTLRHLKQTNMDVLGNNFRKKIFCPMLPSLQKEACLWPSLLKKDVAPCPLRLQKMVPRAPSIIKELPWMSFQQKNYALHTLPLKYRVVFSR